MQQSIRATSTASANAYLSELRSISPLELFEMIYIDLLYLGSNSTITEKEKGYVIKVPCFCTHAYVITNKGAKQLMKLVEEQSEGLGMYKADCAIKTWQKHNKLDCRIWNNVGIGFIMPYPILISSKESTEDSIHLCRNNGLIFQNSLLGSSIHGLSLTHKGKF